MFWLGLCVFFFAAFGFSLLFALKLFLVFLVMFPSFISVLLLFLKPLSTGWLIWFTSTESTKGTKEIMIFTTTLYSDPTSFSDKTISGLLTAERTHHIKELLQWKCWKGGQKTEKIAGRRKRWADLVDHVMQIIKNVGRRRETKRRDKKIKGREKQN